MVRKTRRSLRLRRRWRWLDANLPDADSQELPSIEHLPKRGGEAGREYW